MIALTESMITTSNWISRLKKLLIISGTLLLFLGWRPTVFFESTWEGVFQAVYYDFLQMYILFPFLPYVIGTWLVFIATMIWFRSKYRAISLMVVITICLVSIDTYTGMSLWIETTVIVCSILLLLIVQHFKTLREKSPEGGVT
ncbi:MAG: hypothetical protein LRY73_17080 [Bacillus sp. (in: Bacteria)]|nr:hypothetical protein [Bacillus sp. (in: firmicutes)]